ncbi:ATP-dependent DNA helicase RecG [Candidatus Kaiserbacteria bacterium]|nr:ATP-dependent DNA helicase RecG [Candidatus Kaiserbacteria bacterium]
MLPDDAIAKHFRLNAVHTSSLRRLGLIRLRDLLYHFPVRYEQAGSESHAVSLVPGTKVTLIGKLSGLKAKKLWKSKRNITEGWFEDSSGRVKVMWFNQPYMKSYVKENDVVKMTGAVGGSSDRPYISNPEVEPSTFDESARNLFASSSNPEKQQAAYGAGQRQAASNLFPVYPETKGVTSKWFYHALQRLFAAGVHKKIDDPIPEDVRARYHLPDLASALIWLHVPEKLPHTESARKRFAFEEIFVLQIVRALERKENDAETGFALHDAKTKADTFLASLDMTPTSAQARVVNEILVDLEKPHPMARLLEGDVGSGKTLVAAASSYAVVTSRPPGRTSGTLQVGYMAPTEILAAQHFESFINYFSSRGGSASGGRDLSINIGLITGSGCKKFPSKSRRGYATDISRTQLLKWVANGEIAMLVGTHALIQKKVQFQHLALAIVDEQHRFGTRQRRALAHKAKSPKGDRSNSPEASFRGDAVPHFLSMTATPIPRTLALTMYGDLDISILDELPPGRAKITTEIVKPAERENAYEKMRKELQKGRQAYVICPRIEEPDPAKLNALQAKSAKAEAARLQKDVFPEFAVGLLHGSMTPKEKENVMREFAENKIHILVATSVVEVGVNVPNATVIMIEGAERFGLAQLHQLRGRVMRSSHPPLCFLVPETKGEMAMKRLRMMEKSQDGFVLAESDLSNRGAGDLFGRKQWGVSDIGMEALKNPRLIEAARLEAFALIERAPSLSEYEALRTRAALADAEMHDE